MRFHESQGHELYDEHGYVEDVGPEGPRKVVFLPFESVHLRVWNMEVYVA